MDYPFWEVPILGGGIVIALIAIAHVFVSHFAVGGGLFLVLTERKARREDNRDMLAYVRDHARFFVLLTLVFGAVSGVGIWFAIGLAHPAGTSLLIRNFVFGWAIEWCFFLVEVAAAMIYYYGWDRLSPKTHVKVGWIYFISAYMSLVVINGILAFMLTPGRWLETGRFWDGFFNPSYFPSLLLRTGVAISLTGLYVLLTASMLKVEAQRARMVRLASRWVFAGLGIMPLAGLWYLFAIPAGARHIAFGGAPAVTIFLFASLGDLGLSARLHLVDRIPHAGAVQSGARSPLPGRRLRRDGLLGVGARGGSQALHRPWSHVLEQHPAGAGRGAVEDGLPSRRALGLGARDHAANRHEAGVEIFRFQCESCHTVDGYNAIRPLIRGWRESFITGQLRHLDELKGFMPPFTGTDEERRVLAHYLASLWGYPAETQPIPSQEVPR